MSISNLTSSQLRQAADLKEKIEALQTELEQITGESSAVIPAPVAPKKRGRPRKEAAAVVVQNEQPKPGKRGPKKGGMSAAGRAAIAAAQKARWAKAKVAKSETVAEKSAEAKPAKKRKMSAAGRAAIAAAAKARWAKVKAALPEA
jgi:hypothetical protein